MPPALSSLPVGSGGGGGGGGGATTFAAADALDAEKLNALTDKQVVGFLHNSVRVLRHANLAGVVQHCGGKDKSKSTATPSSSTSSFSLGPRGPSARSPAAAAPAAVTTVSAVDAQSARETIKSFVKALLSSSRFTRSDDADVAQLVACLLCDALRLSGEAASLLEDATAQAAGDAKGQQRQQHEAPDTLPATRTFSSSASLTSPMPRMLWPSALSVTALPFSVSSSLDVLRAIAEPFRLVCEVGERALSLGAGSNGVGVGLQRCDLVIERAAASHALLLLLPLCLSGQSGASSEKEAAEVEGIIQCFFSSVAFASGGPHAAAVGRGSGKGEGGGTGNAWSATLAAEMARVLGDILSATNSVTEDQLRPLLDEVIAASTTLHHSGGGKESAGRAASSAGAAIAGRVFLEQIDVIQPAVASVAMGHLEQGVEQLAAAEVAHRRLTAPPRARAEEGEGEEEHAVSRPSRATPAAGRHTSVPDAAHDKQELERLRRPALREVARALEVLTAMMELNVNLCVQLVPALLPYLSHGVADVRLLLLRGFVAAWTSNQSAFHAYHSAILTVLHRFNDVKPAIRVEAVEAAGKVIAVAASPAKPWPTSLVEEVWGALRPCLEQRLTDLHVMVRVQAVQAYADALAAIPGIATSSDPHPSPGAAGGALEGRTDPSVSRDLALTLGLRTADKNARVRERAVDRLCQLYRTHAAYYPWIPDSVMSTVKAEGGLKLVEAGLESMLPPPDAKAGSTAAAAATRTLAVFDFEKDEEGEVHHGATYVSALVQLCADMQESSFHQLLAIVRKKPQLRLTIRRLFELRAEVKGMADPRSPEGQTCITNIHRLLSFLQEATYAEKGEWDALFRTRDDRVARSLLSACQGHVTNWLQERSNLLSSLKGRLEPDVYRFVSGSLARQMMLPLNMDHLQELLGRISEAFTMRVLQRRQRRMSQAHETARDGSEDDGQALLRVLLLFVSASPSFFPRCTDTLLRVLESITQTAAATTTSENDTSDKGGCPAPVCDSKTLLLLLQAIKAWAVYEATRGGHGPQAAGQEQDSGNGGEDGAEYGNAKGSNSMSSALTASSLPKQRKHDVLSTLGQLCLGGRAALNLSRRAPSEQITAQNTDAVTFAPDTEALSHISRAAAQALVALVAVPAFGEAKALDRLVQALGANLSARAASQKQEGANKAAPARRKTANRSDRHSTREDGDDHDASTATGIRAIAWLHAVSSLAEDSSSRALVQSDDALASNVTDVLLAAVRDESDRADNERLVKRGTLAERREQLFAHPSLASATVAAAAKALVSVAVSHGADRRRSGAVSATLDALLAAYKLSVTLAGGARSIGACQRRLAIELQLARILVQPSSDIGKELAVAVILSAEDEEVAQDAVQKRLTEHLLQDTCDMRYAAFLLMTAMGCESKAGYQELRSSLATVGDHLRKRQAATRATLSHPAAMQCYLEYTIPFLVLFMSHHTFYEVERTTDNFTAFQRVWHLLFEELFRHGTQCASFVVELLGRVKSSDDVLDRDSDAHRVLCDLGSRVMWECLGQRQTSADTLKRFPGFVLLPNFFVKTTRPDAQALLTTVFLDASVPIAASAPLRVLTAAVTGGEEGSASREASRTATPRQSLARSTNQRRLATAAAGAGGEVEGRQAGRATADAAHLQLSAGGDNEEEESTDADFDLDGGDFTPYGRRAPPPSASAGKQQGRAAEAGQPPSRGAGATARTGRRRRRSVSASEPSAMSSSSASDSSAESRSSPDQRQRKAARVERVRRPTPAREGEGSDANSVRRSGLPQGHAGAVDKVLDELLDGLHKPQIAELRWKAVKAKIEREVGATDEGGKAVREAALEYAREQLRSRYEAAEP